MPPRELQSLICHAMVGVGGERTGNKCNKCSLLRVGSQFISSAQNIKSTAASGNKGYLQHNFFDESLLEGVRKVFLLHHESDPCLVWIWEE